MKLEFVKPKEEIVVTGKVGDRLKLHTFSPPHTTYEFTVEKVEDCNSGCADCCGKIMIGKDIKGLHRSDNNRFCSMHNLKSWVWLKVN
jgi:hypothetical protein